MVVGRTEFYLRGLIGGRVSIIFYFSLVILIIKIVLFTWLRINADLRL